MVTLSLENNHQNHRRDALHRFNVAFIASTCSESAKALLDAFIITTRGFKKFPSIMHLATSKHLNFFLSRITKCEVFNELLFRILRKCSFPYEPNIVMILPTSRNTKQRISLDQREFIKKPKSFFF